MRRTTRTRTLVGLLVIGALAGCGGDPAPSTPSSAAPSTRAVTRADAEGCPVTRARRWRPPAGVAVDALFGDEVAHGNGKLWVGGLEEDGVVEVGAGPVGIKLGWWREVAGRLRIDGRRLDGPAPPLRADVPGGYGDRGFQASGVWFPAAGCWEVTGTVGPTSLSFVTFVT